MAHKHQNSAEQKAKKQDPGQYKEEFSTEVAHKPQPAPGHKEHKRNKMN
ncbi:hypothetical protein ACTSEZ_06890 [Metabacillus sp. JX24]